MVGELAFVADYDSGLQVIDISIPSSPSIIGSFPTPYQANDVVLAGDLAYVGDGRRGYAPDRGSLHVVAIVDPFEPFAVGTVSLPDDVRGLAAYGELVYVANEHAGDFRIVDLSDPSQPTVLSVLQTPDEPWDVEVRSGYAYVAARRSGLLVVDISDPNAPHIVGSVDTPDFAQAVCLSGDYAYVADGASGLQVISVATPTMPTLIGEADTGGEAYDVAIVGSCGYVAAGGLGLCVVDITDPASPAAMAFADTPGEARGVAMAGDHVLVADGDAGVQVFQAMCGTSPAFEFLSASFDNLFYQNGVDTAHVSIETTSNWGGGMGIELIAMLRPNIGDSIPLGTDSFTLVPGQSQVSSFDWTVPEYPGLRMFDLELELSRVGAGVFMTERNNMDIVGTNVSQADIVQVQQEMEGCQAGAACLGAMVGAVPFLGTLTAMEQAKDLRCLTESLHEHDNERGAAVMGIAEGLHVVMTVVNGFEEVAYLTGTPLGPAVTIGNLIGEAVSIGLVCGGELGYWASGYPGRGEFGAFISELADSAEVALALSGMDYSNELFVEGVNSVRVSVDSAFTSTDSMGIAVAYVLPLPDYASSWTHIGPEPRWLGSDHENPEDVCSIQICPDDGADTLGVVLLHRIWDDSVVKSEYDFALVQPTTLITLDLSRDVAQPALRIDYDGDGEIDEYRPPIGFSGVADWLPVGQESVRLTGLRASPNPSSGPATISFQTPMGLRAAEILIYDVTGREVRRLPLGDVGPGPQQVAWDALTNYGEPVPAGLYLYRILHSTGESAAGRVVVVQ